MAASACQVLWNLSIDATAVAVEELLRGIKWRAVHFGATLHQTETPIAIALIDGRRA